MTTLTKSRIDVADRHTSVYFLKGGFSQDPLQIGDRRSYQKMHSDMLSSNSRSLPAKGATIDRLYSTLSETPQNYWDHYGGVSAGEVWEEAVPILGVMNYRVDLKLPQTFAASVKAAPYVLLYPFGWSVWISILVVGIHTMQDLSDLVIHLFHEKSVSSNQHPVPVKLSNHFEAVTKQIRNEAFGAGATEDQKDSDLALVTTVLEKHGGSLSLGALGQQGEQQLRSLVRPSGPKSNRALGEQIYRFCSSDDPGYELNYVVSDRLGHFIWMEKLLAPKDKNQMKLECYHHNSFRALIQAWHLWSFINYCARKGLFNWANSVAKKKERNQFKLLLERSFNRLEEFGYKNASLRAFLEGGSLAADLESARQRSGALLL